MRLSLSLMEGNQVNCRPLYVDRHLQLRSSKFISTAHCRSLLEKRKKKTRLNEGCFILIISGERSTFALNKNKNASLLFIFHPGTRTSNNETTNPLSCYFVIVLRTDQNCLKYPTHYTQRNSFVSLRGCCDCLICFVAFFTLFK